MHDPTDLDLRAYAHCAAQYPDGCSCERNRVAPCVSALRAAEIEARPPSIKSTGPEPEPEPAPDREEETAEPPSGAGKPTASGKKWRRVRATIEPPPLRLGLSPEERLDLEKNDADNAARLYAVIGDRVLYVQGKGWAVIRGGRFDFRSGDIRAFELGSRLRDIVLEEARAAGAKEPTEEEGLVRLGKETRKQKPAFETVEDAIRVLKIEAFADLAQHATKCGNNAMVERALVALRHHVAAEIEDLDADPAILVVPNGIVDLDKVAEGYPDPAGFEDEAAQRKAILETRKSWLREHDLSSLPTKSAAPAFDPEADCPEWRAFIALIQPEREAQIALQRALGMLVYGRNDAQVALLLRGPGGNGKSTLVEILSEVLGDYAQPCRVEMFITSQNESAGRATPEEVELPGARALIASEPDPTDELSSKKIKAMTGGDKRPARALNMPQFIYRPTGVPILSFNRTPRIKGEDEGTRRRLYFIPFEVNLRALPPQEQKSPREVEWRLRAELPGILNWLLDGFIDFRERGLAPPEAWSSLKDDLLADSDPVGEFIADCCEVQTGAKIGTQEFYRVFVEWCARTGAHEYQPRTFNRVMTEKRFLRQKTGGGRMFWSGLKWASGAEVGSLLTAAGFNENPAPDDRPGSPPDDDPPPF